MKGVSRLKSTDRSEQPRHAAIRQNAQLGERTMLQSARGLLPLSLRLGLTAGAALCLLTAGAQAACKGNWCVSGSDRGGIHTVNFTGPSRGVTHYNVSTPQGQRELGRNQSQFSFRTGPRGSKGSYGIQACIRGGVFASSSCGKWVHFNYTVK
jgi:hypothetical protein